MRLVLLFPGQGVQYVGMGAELAELGGEVAAPFAHASAALGEDVLAICRAGPAERLTRTLYAQPAIVATSLAALAALRAAAAERGVPLSPMAVFPLPCSQSGDEPCDPDPLPSFPTAWSSS